jgi:uncharacterized membrane protein
VQGRTISQLIVRFTLHANPRGKQAKERIVNETKKGRTSMKNNNLALFCGAIIAALVCIGISVYYIIPGYNHLLVTHDFTSSHPTHAFAFFALAVICVVVALVTRPKSVSKERVLERER